MQQFLEHGYLEIDDWIDPSQLTGWVEEVCAWPETPGRHMVYYENGRVTRIENFVPYHEGLRDLLTGERTLSALQELFGEPAVLFKDKVNFKPPGGSGFEWHQDVQAGWDDYGSLHISLMIPLDPCTVENGCLEVAPGWHNRGLLGEMWKPLDWQGPRQPLLSRPGQAVFFDSYLPHGSGPNLTDRPRRVLYATYGRQREGDHRERYFAEKRRNYPPDIEREPGRVYAFKV